MKTTVRNLLMFVLVTMSVFAVQAKDSGFALLPALRYTSTETTTTTTSKSTIMNIDLDLGWKMDSGLILGAAYLMYNTSVDTGSSTTVGTTGYGPMVGYWHDGGFLALFTYVFSLSRTTSSGGTDIKDTGDGMKFDIGYLFKIGSSGGVGPTLTYFTYTYKKRSISGSDSDISPAEKHTDMLLPGLQFGFVF